MNGIDPEDKEAESGGGISGFVQKVIGEIETIGGALTGDPNTAAEGEFNIEVGDIREELEEELDDSEKDEHPAGGSW